MRIVKELAYGNIIVGGGNMMWTDRIRLTNMHRSVQVLYKIIGIPKVK